MCVCVCVCRVGCGGGKGIGEAQMLGGEKAAAVNAYEVGESTARAHHLGWHAARSFRVNGGTLVRQGWQWTQ